MDTTPDTRFRLDDFASTALAEHADGWRLARLWLATNPQKHEVASVARIWRELRDGGVTGCDSLPLDAEHYPSFLNFLRDTPHEREVEDGVESMRVINERQGTNFPSWPRRVFFVGFDEEYLLGFASACNTAIRMGSR